MGGDLWYPGKGRLIIPHTCKFIQRWYMQAADDYLQGLPRRVWVCLCVCVSECGYLLCEWVVTDCGVFSFWSPTHSHFHACCSPTR